MYRHVIYFVPTALQNLFTLNNKVHCHYTQNRNNARITNNKSSAVHRSFLYLSPIVWHTLPNSVKIAQTSKSFKLKNKQTLLDRYIEI